MQDPSLPLTLEEIGEWGDPRIREHRDNIASYCSCHNIIPQVNHSDVTSTTVQKFGLGMIFFKPIKKTVPNPNFWFVVCSVCLIIQESINNCFLFLFIALPIHADHCILRWLYRVPLSGVMKYVAKTKEGHPNVYHSGRC